MSDFDFNKKEKKILDFWRDNKVFEKSLENRQKAKRFVWWEGPPTANGKPGIHHLLGRAFKDLYGRYKTMSGFYVLRKSGWDTHGLAVEIEIEKELGFKNKKDIETYGIAQFNKKAKESVLKYKTEWEDMTRKMGFWLDVDYPYITYETNYIESLWSIIKKIWDKNLLYFAHRVVPFCVRCGTPLSSHEVAQGYRRTTDRSVFVKFKVKSLKLKVDEKKLSTFHFPLSTYILAWTTTPWTLPGNVALAVGKDIDYVVVEVGEENYILAEATVEKIFKSDSKFEIQDSKFKGSDLVGLEYEPLFDIKELKSDKSYKIYDADFVTIQDGTGVVHTAVMYGEDDYDLGTKVGLPKFHTVDEQGKFIHVGQGLDGMYVKDKNADAIILEILNKNGNFLKTEEYEHDYPFCWRCGTPLLYYAKNSWFIKMSAVNKELLANNQKVNWVPEHIKEGRFGQWLKESKDWAFSRERYWGTPLPVWKCTKCPEHRVAGSLEDLEKYRFKPKNEYYVMRHGHSTKNGFGDTPAIISSILNNDKYPLTEQGKKEALEAGKKLKKAGGVDLIISSPFIRTKETAHIVAEELGKKIHLDDRIMEFQHGQACEEKKDHVCGIKFGKGDWEAKTLDGESWKDLKKRMSSFLRDIDSQHEEKKILIVSHGDPIWLLENFTRGLTGEEAVATKDDGYIHEGELKKIDFKNWPYDDNGDLDMHRPYIDAITLKCDKCGSEMKKIPDLIDVWFDSGAMPYAQWHWPFDKAQGEPFDGKKMFEEQFPADFIVEAIDQTRGWFYTLLAVSTLLGKGNPYKNVICHGHVLDAKGQKMSKSKGNTVSPFDVMEKFGADSTRWYFYTINSPGESKLFTEKDVQSKLVGFISTLQNCLRFYELYGNGEGNTFHDVKAKDMNLLDKWILSRFNGLVMTVTDDLDKYEVTHPARAIEKFMAEDFSNWWLRRSRKRKEALGLLRFLLLEIAKLVAPFIPFSAEDIHMRLHQGRSSGTQSVHLHDWPKVNKKLIDKELEKQMDEIQKIVTVGLAQRKEQQIKVRQPLRSVFLGLSNEITRSDLGGKRSDLEDLIKGELNVKEIVYDKSQKELVVLNTELDEALIYEGYARELMRQIQDMRKEAGYKVDDEVFGQWHSDNADLSAAINKWSDEIKKEVVLKKFDNSQKGDQVYDIEKEFELVTGKKIWVGIKK